MIVAAIETKQHVGIWSDVTKQTPIVGTRFTKQMKDDTYDICEAVFAKLSAEEQAEVTAVEVPDIKLLVKYLLEQSAGNSNYKETEDEAPRDDVVLSQHTDVMEAMQTKQRCIAALARCGMSPAQVEMIVAAIETKQHVGIWCDVT